MALSPPGSPAGQLATSRATASNAAAATALGLASETNSSSPKPPPEAAEPFDADDHSMDLPSVTKSSSELLSKGKHDRKSLRMSLRDRSARLNFVPMDESPKPVAPDNASTSSDESKSYPMHHSLSVPLERGRLQSILKGSVKTLSMMSTLKPGTSGGYGKLMKKRVQFGGADDEAPPPSPRAPPSPRGSPMSWQSEDETDMVGAQSSHTLSSSGTGDAGGARQWRRQAQRRALTRGAAERNCYVASCPLVGPTNKRLMMRGPSWGTVQAWLNVYDLRGCESSNQTTHSWFGVGLYHIGVEVFGVEWSYGSSEESDSIFDKERHRGKDSEARLVTGLYPIDAKQSDRGVLRDSICLGAVRDHSAQDFWNLLSSMAGAWLSADYDAYARSSQHFCSELCEFLGVREPPAWVGRFAECAEIVVTSVIQPCRTAPAEGTGRRSTRRSHPSGGAVLSAATSLALDFEARFSWALMAMLLNEARGNLGTT